ncbi:RNA-binding region-containing protein 3 [Brevipalpus obovatus]|uniref:RNA-binding region-containing protein 3 n=1 Tax=Brevipalpus obovatus TaxID=246614 RepID=UPI003D9DD954
MIQSFDEMSSTATSNFEVPIPVELKKFWEHIHHIAPRLGVNYPSSPFLKYKYPPATKMIVKNIAKALLRYPDFYTQVLHLMNRMNLMPPFLVPNSNESHENDDDAIDLSDGSEEEEEEELVDGYTFQKNEPIKVKPVYKKMKRRLRLELLANDNKMPTKKKSTCSKANDLQDFFDTIPLPNKSSVKISLSTTNLNSMTDEGCKSTEETHGFGRMERKVSQNSEETAVQEKSPTIEMIIEQQELMDGVLPQDKWHEYPALRNYSTGPPCSRLYVKNLSKSVSESDLNRIFARYVDWNDEDHYGVQYFKEGKLRGQAFISLPNEQQAGQAIRETNAFILKDKPIVVSYARSATRSVH